MSDYGNYCIIDYYLHVLARIRRNSYLKHKPKEKNIASNKFLQSSFDGLSSDL